jgi:chromatin structure-remodeling complex protein RSC7
VSPTSDIDSGAYKPTSGAPTPTRGKGRGRPPALGSNGGRPGNSTQMQLDKEGRPQEVVNDEIVLIEDPLGQAKVDENGYLQGGRRYRCTTFTLSGRGERLYMISIEAARCLGYTKTSVFFAKHDQLFKIIADRDEKVELIKRSIIPNSGGALPIGIVTARSVFREFGARIIFGGRRIIDDFWETRARDEGVVQDDHIKWKAEHAAAGQNFNQRLREYRHTIAPVTGVYEAHTNLMQFPMATQPTMVRWNKIEVHDEDTNRDTIVVKEVLEPKPWVGRGLGAAVGELGDGFGEWDDSLLDALETEEQKEAVRQQIAKEREWAARW